MAETALAGAPPATKVGAQRRVHLCAALFLVQKPLVALAPGWLVEVGAFTRLWGNKLEGMWVEERGGGSVEHLELGSGAMKDAGPSQQWEWQINKAPCVT